ncbi:MAG: glycosyl transferase [bacterium]|nr:MAG: glycosyl transferase [bacterium]
MRIFVLLSRIPYPLEKGDKLRAFHQIKVLSEKHEIILCALNPLRNADKQKAFEQLQPYCRSINFIDLPACGRMVNILRAYFSGFPLQSGYFYSRRANRKIKALVAEYQPDHLFAQLSRTARYLMNVSVKKTLDYQDAFSYGLKRRADKAGWLMKPVFRMEYKRMEAFEKEIFDLFDQKIIISEQDRDLIPHPEKYTITVIRNGVDMEFFHPLSRKKKQEIVFTGNMNYQPNIDAALFLAKEIMPLVWQRKPDTRLLLAGASPHHKVRSLARRKIKVSGWIDDIREAYAASAIFIAPMRMGTGLQNKLLEAMAMKIPCITTPIANDALKAKEKEEILTGSSTQQLADALLFLLDNQQAGAEMAENAFGFVKRNYHWSEATAPLEKLMCEISS